MRMRKRAFLKLICVFCVIHFIFLQGCIPGDKMIFPIKAEDYPNTFRLSERNWNGRVIYVKVFNRDKSEVLWHIRAKNDKPIKDFVVTVGEVAEGFEQVIPAANKRFILVRGNEYLIEIMCWDLSPPAFIGEKAWVAD